MYLFAENNRLRSSVLILVAVEDGLVQNLWNVSSLEARVLILVVVDDGLVHIALLKLAHNVLMS